MNIRQVRKKTKSVSNVKKITRSMQLVSAIKMKKAQVAAIESRPYQENLENIIFKIVGNIDQSLSLLLTPRKEAADRHLIIFITANKGLCGAFNFDLFRYVSKMTDIKNTDFVAVGKKGA